MKAQILDINGKEKGSIELPKFFSDFVREDVIAKVVEAQKTQQPYAPNPNAGKGYSASGKLKHHRKVWKSQYGRGMSRIPRKIMSRRGSQFNWVGATVPQARGGLRAHPPKIASFLRNILINKKEKSLALKSAITATADAKKVSTRYERLSEKDLKNLPLVVEGKITSLKTKEILASLKKILGENLFVVATKEKSVRAGKGTRRGRKYKSTAGLLLVIGKEEKLKTKRFEVKNVGEVSVTDLAKGGSGRLTIYTENAIKELGEKLK